MDPSGGESHGAFCPVCEEDPYEISMVSEIVVFAGGAGDAGAVDAGAVLRGGDRCFR